MFDSRIQRFSRLAYSDGAAAYVLPSGVSRRSTAASSCLAKRTEDVVIALGVLVILGPLMLVTAAAIRLTSRGPVLFSQERVGLHGRRFRMLKFRTMIHSPDAEYRQATRNDPRVTWLGTLLRRSSIDELPQLFNVLAGSMSIVGPRPHAPGTCAAGRPFESITPRYAARHCVKPGMTGLAQVRGWRGQTDTEEKLLHRVESDLEYVATWTIGGDLLILCRTVVSVLRMRNAW